jgi:hypothetical protein
VTPGAHIRYLGEELGGITDAQSNGASFSSGRWSAGEKTGGALGEGRTGSPPGGLRQGASSRGSPPGGLLQGVSTRSRNSLTEPLVSDETKESNLISSSGM